mmetsp:Transcript_19896/g.64746  ORF Transcript_19896/g.64746 Transcript_19896/m.64746 type:complete len:527 (+) Transcript_19896:129-1709(+)
MDERASGEGRARDGDGPTFHARALVLAPIVQNFLEHSILSHAVHHRPHLLRIPRAVEDKDSRFAVVGAAEADERVCAVENVRTHPPISERWVCLAELDQLFRVIEELSRPWILELFVEVHCLAHRPVALRASRRSFEPEFLAVVQARDARSEHELRHRKRRVALRVVEARREPRRVVAAQKVEEQERAVHVPVPFERVRELVIVAVVEARPHRFVQLIVCAGVEKAGLDKVSVVSVHELAEQEAVSPRFAADARKLGPEMRVNLVCHVEPPTVDALLPAREPVPCNVEDVVSHRTVLVIEPDQSIVPFPAFEYHSSFVTIEPAMEPVPILARTAVLHDIDGGEMARSCVIKNAVEYDSQPSLVRGFDHLAEQSLVTQATVDPKVICSIVSVAELAGFEQWPEVEDCRAERRDVVEPAFFEEAAQARLRRALAIVRQPFGAAKAERLHLVHHRILVPLRIYRVGSGRRRRMVLDRDGLDELFEDCGRRYRWFDSTLCPLLPLQCIVQGPALHLVSDHEIKSIGGPQR